MANQVWVIRHGDRFDFDVGKDQWEKIAQSINDPVLSDLGHSQASETAQAIYSACLKSDAIITRVITSPFIRCIQTANPIAGKFNTELCIDDSLFEVVYTTEEFPPRANRAHYYPRVSLSYVSEDRPAEDESFPAAAMVRYGLAAKKLTGKFPGENICLVTHAAGVSAVVASLCNGTVGQIGAVYPASMFCLQLDPSTGLYSVMPGLHGTIDHFTQPMGKTQPWPRRSDNSDDWGNQWIAHGETISWG